MGVNIVLKRFFNLDIAMVARLMKKLHNPGEVVAPFTLEVSLRFLTEGEPFCEPF